MIDIKLDPTTNDLSYNGHDLELLTDVDALVQSLLIRLRTFYGEWDLNTSIGVRYFEDIMVKNPDLGKVESLLKAEILSTPGVNSLLSFDLIYDAKARTAAITFTCDSTFGVVPVNNMRLT
jgi:hypothetical protein